MSKEKEAFKTQRPSQKPQRQPRKTNILSQNQPKLSQKELYFKIIELAKTPFKTPSNGIQFKVKEDLSYERKLCDQIISLLHEWEDSAQKNPGNAVFMHIQSHGVEKVITTRDDLKALNTIGQYVKDKYELNDDIVEDLDNYIKNQIRYSSTVPSGYCNVLQSPAEPSQINSDTIEYELVSMYMKRYNRGFPNGQGLNILFDILRLRKRYFFVTLNSNTHIQRGSTSSHRDFIKDTNELSNTPEYKTSREYSTQFGVGINNKSFIFSPNEGETDNNLYGIHLFSYNNGELNAQNLSQGPVSQSLITHQQPPPPPQPNAWIQRIVNFFWSNTTTKTTETKSRIIHLIGQKLTSESERHLTLADIFLLGWAIGKKLFIFDPSCNYIENLTNTTETRTSIFPKSSRGRDANYGLKGHFLSTGQNINPTQDRYGGKKRNTKRRKTNKKLKKKRTRQIRRTRHTRRK